MATNRLVELYQPIVWQLGLGLWQTAAMSKRSTPSAPPPGDASSPTGDRPRAPRKRDAEVLAAAARVFYEQGYADASVQDVADAVGILKGSLYHYIETKEDLLYRLLEEVHEDVQDVLVQVAAEEGLDPFERLHLYISRQLEYNARNLVKISVYYHDVERLSTPRREAIYALRRTHEDFVTDLVREAQGAGLADRTPPPRVVARWIFATIIWIYRWYRPEGSIQPVDLARMGADFATAGVRGLQPPGAPD